MVDIRLLKKCWPRCSMNDLDMPRVQRFSQADASRVLPRRTPAGGLAAGGASVRVAGMQDKAVNNIWLAG